MSLFKCLITLNCFLVLFSCQEKGIPLEQSREYFVEYLLAHDKAYLDSSYNSLTSKRYLDKTGLNETNKDIVMPLFIYMKKYDELETLLRSNQDMKTFDKSLALNLTRSLAIYPEDSTEAKRLMHENLQLIEREMETNPDDSLLWGSHFTARMYLVGRQKVLQEIDSLKSVNSRYPDIFYEYTLKEIIREYPDELMYKRNK